MPERLLLVRALGQYVPVVAAVLLWRQRVPSPRAATGIVLATAWNFVSLIAVNRLAMYAGWWRFDAPGVQAFGIPLDLLIGWAVLWGMVAPLAAPAASLPALIIAAALVDVLVMPLYVPLLTLGSAWLVGEGVALLVGFLPGILLARWTRDTRQLPARATLQLMLFGAFTLALVPATILEHTRGSWEPLTGDTPRWIMLQLQVVAIPALLGVSALQEFVVRGGGTPLPFDPPQRLVTTGPYAYVANPMQLSAALLLVVWGAVLQSPWVALAGVMGWVYSIGLARMDEGIDLEARFGDAWRAYRRDVRDWLPRWRPAHAPARLYVAMSCGPCSEIGRWLEARGTVSLEICPAESHPERDLRRITYEMPGDPSVRDEGVAALARAAEHINLAWAMLGFFARLPVVCQLLQLLVDVSGGEARLVERRSPSVCAAPEGAAGAP